MDVIGARSLALSAYLGIAPSNDGIFTNPAGLVAQQRYAVEGTFLQNRVGSEADAQFLGASVVDSQSTTSAMGFAYSHLTNGPFPGSTYHLALAMPVTQGFYLGTTGKYLSLNGPGTEEVRAVTADAGLFWQLSTLISVGAAGYNLIPVGHRSQVPPGLGAGIGVGNEQSFLLAADWRADFGGTGGKLRNVYAVGAEYLASNAFPLRASILKDDRLGAKFWAVGIGLITGSGLAVDLAYRQDMAHSDHRTLAANLKVFLPSAAAGQ